MAVSSNQQATVPYNSPGIYFQETDLTTITQQVGGFSAGAIALTEKGPAFSVSTSTTFTDRAFRLGDQNPAFPSSYFAKQYLEQAQTYREVRMLGLQGYSDTVGYGITIANTSPTPSTAADLSAPTPLAPGTYGLVCVMKARPISVTTGAEVVSVIVQEATYIDPLTGFTVTRASDYLFQLQISYLQPLVGSIVPDVVLVSLRPESKDYIYKKFGSNPLATPLIGNKIAPLWIDFIIPSVVSMPTIASTQAYYIPGIPGAPSAYIDLTLGETAFGSTFTSQQGTANPNDSIIPGTIAPIVSMGVTTGVQVVLDGSTGDVTVSGAGWLLVGSDIFLEGITGTGNIGALNGAWQVGSADFGVTFAGQTTFTLLDIATGNPVTSIIPTSTLSTSTSAPIPTVVQYIPPTWEPSMLNMESVFTTPSTPWFVSDGNANGHIKQLFQFWSISDGTSANTEIKIEIANINPSTNTTSGQGNGSFTVIVRDWNDTEDGAGRTALETYTNVNMDPADNNYILRKIGDGDNFPLQSSFIFISMNTEIEIEPNDLPWGCLGYPNIGVGDATTMLIQDVPWTTDYVKTKSTAKQALGLASNSINMNAPVFPSLLSYKSNPAITGRGFHLNPNQNSNLVTLQANTLTFAPPTIYVDLLGNPVTPLAKIAASGFVVDFYGGFDGWNVYSSRTWSDPSSPDFQSLTLAIAAFADKEDVNSDFTVLTTPDLDIDNDSYACSTVLEMVNNRGDCLYIPDFQYDPSADPQVAVASLIGSNMMSNNVAMYFPYLQMQDTLNNVNNWLPPSILALGTIAYVATNEQVWQPPGGSIRTITNNLIRSRRRLNQSDREILFSNSTASINPITTFPGSGYEIAGVRTTQSDFSALSFIHNRLLLCYAKKILTQILRPLLFSLNGALTQDIFLSTVRPIFARIKKLNGIADFKVNIVNTDNSTAGDLTTIYGQIVIQPLYPTERIICDFVIADNAVSFAG